MKLGFIGMGNMGAALARGFLSSGKIKGHDIIVFDKNAEKLENVIKELECFGARSEKEVAERSDMVIMACKPYHVEGALAAAGEALCGKALLSIALGWDHAAYRAVLPESVRVQFVMPNTPAMVGEGMFLFEKTNSFTEEELAFALALFAAIGEVETLPTDLMGIGGALSGCGPAFVDLLIESFADAGVLYGMPRDKAYKLVAQTVKGAAKLQLETGMHPGVLKDMVCSPGGSTIRGVAALEHNGMRSACISAIEAIMET
ncbi:MAG: pyrroline-5-carboxylate reductase [Ruminococcaceae bacterium]|nr:pyrroline-5-carboxylate reductase [Oscillospiraceae bacterium]